MKTDLRPRHFIAALGLAVFSAAGYATTAPTGTILPPNNAVVTISVSDPAPGPSADLAFAATVEPAGDSTQWSEIKDETFAMRTVFIAGLKRLEAKLDAQIIELRARRALQNVAAKPRRDIAIKQMGYARSYLQFLSGELNKATLGTWDEAKLKVGLAWARTQKFYAMGKSGTTS